MSAAHIVLFVVLAFAALVTVHVLGSAWLATKSPRWNAALALLIPPFFPYFALRRRAFGWSIAWAISAATYAAALVIALRWR